MKALSFSLILLLATVPALADPSLKPDAPDNVKTYWTVAHEEKTRLATELKQNLSNLQQQLTTLQNSGKSAAKNKKAEKNQNEPQIKSVQQQIKDCDQDLAKANNPAILPPISLLDMATALAGANKEDVTKHFGYVTGAIGVVGADRLNGKTREEDSLEVEKIIDAESFLAKVHYTVYTDNVTRDDKVIVAAADKSAGNTSTLDQPVLVSNCATKGFVVGESVLRGKTIEAVGTKESDGKSLLNIKPFEIKKYLLTSGASTQPAGH